MFRYVIKNQRNGLYTSRHELTGYTCYLTSANFYHSEKDAKKDCLENEKVVLVEITVKKVK